MTTYRRCPREYFFYYVILRRPRGLKDAALRFGSLFHCGLNAWWRCDGAPLEKLIAAIDAVNEETEKNPLNADPFDLARAEVLLIGYTARWGDEPLRTIAVEKQFRFPIDNPGTVYDQHGIVGHTEGEPFACIQGAIDGVAFDLEIGENRNLEHKTTSLDISPGSNYWRHVIALDSQVSTYQVASNRLGYNPIDTIYDAVHKPALMPLKATPEEARKYTKPTKAAPIPRLYANQRETDETLQEYYDRLVDEIADHPDRYYQRQPISRLESENIEHQKDVLETAELIRFSTDRNAWPRFTNACERYGRLCDYHDVCSGFVSIDDGTRFETKERKELTEA